MANTTILHRIEFVKKFLTGSLAGLSVRQSVVYPQSMCSEIQARLNEHTPENPAEDLITRNKYWVSGIGCSEVGVN